MGGHKRGWLTRVLGGLVALGLLIGCGGGGGGGSGTESSAKQVTVTGRVVDSKGLPLAGATVTIASDPVTIQTKQDGTFSAAVAEGTHRLTVSYGGTTIYERTFTATPGAPVSLGVLSPEMLFFVTGETWFKDADGDGVSDGGSRVETTRPHGYFLASELAATAGDCDDSRSDVRPGATDVCGDGVDGDCSGADAWCVDLEAMRALGVLASHLTAVALFDQIPYLQAECKRIQGEVEALHGAYSQGASAVLGPATDPGALLRAVRDFAYGNHSEDQPSAARLAGTVIAAVQLSKNAAGENPFEKAMGPFLVSAAGATAAIEEFLAPLGLNEDVTFSLVLGLRPSIAIAVGETRWQFGLELTDSLRALREAASLLGKSDVVSMLDAILVLGGGTEVPNESEYRWSYTAATKTLIVSFEFRVGGRAAFTIETQLSPSSGALWKVTVAHPADPSTGLTLSHRQEFGGGGDPVSTAVREFLCKTAAPFCGLELEMRAVLREQPILLQARWEPSTETELGFGVDAALGFSAYAGLGANASVGVQLYAKGAVQDRSLWEDPVLQGFRSGLGRAGRYLAGGGDAVELVAATDADLLGFLGALRAGLEEELSDPALPSHLADAVTLGLSVYQGGGVGFGFGSENLGPEASATAQRQLALGVELQARAGLDLVRLLEDHAGTSLVDGLLIPGVMVAVYPSGPWAYDLHRSSVLFAAALADLAAKATPEDLDALGRRLATSLSLGGELVVGGKLQGSLVLGKEGQAGYSGALSVNGEFLLNQLYWHCRLLHELQGGDPQDAYGRCRWMDTPGVSPEVEFTVDLGGSLGLTASIPGTPSLSVGLPIFFQKTVLRGSISLAGDPFGGAEDGGAAGALMLAPYPAVAARLESSQGGNAVFRAAARPKPGTTVDRYAWFVDGAGPLGHDETFSWAFAEACEGRHLVEVTAIQSDGAQGTFPLLHGCDPLPPPPSLAVLVLARNASALDAEERRVTAFLDANGYAYDLADPSSLAGRLAARRYGALFCRTGAVPSGYAEAGPLAALRAAVEGGAALLVEYHGSYLAQYLGLGTVSSGNWGPAVMDKYYFVAPRDASPIFDGVPRWDPPTTPDDASKLLWSLDQRGSFTCRWLPSLRDQQAVRFWKLYTAYGWPYLGTNSSYCQQWGGCTSQRSVGDLSILYTSLGAGKVVHHAVVGTNCNATTTTGAAGEALLRGILRWVGVAPAP